MRSRVAGALCGIAAGFLVAAAIGYLGPQGRPASIRAIPDSAGHVRSVLIHYDPAAADAVANAYRDTISALSPDTGIRVAVARAEDFDDLVERLRAGGVAGLDRLEPLVVGRPITIWSRDRFVTARRGDRPTLVTPPQTLTVVPGRADDWLVPWLFGKDSAGRVDVVQAPFVFDGGDFAADEKRLYATALVAHRNRGTRFGDVAALRDELAGTFGLEVLLIGATVEDVPNHHVGMFLAPIGGDTVVVGDPDLAVRTLREAGDSAALEAVGADLSDATLARFRFVAGELRAAGLRVVPVPLVPTLSPWVFVTYTNVLVDDRPDGRHVLLPQFGIPSLDVAARAAWSALGFKVHPIDVSGLYRNGGTVHCVAAVLERATGPSRAAVQALGRDVVRRP